MKAYYATPEENTDAIVDIYQLEGDDDIHVNAGKLGRLDIRCCVNFKPYVGLRVCLSYNDDGWVLLQADSQEAKELVYRK